MKKNLSKAMAAAMAIGTVAPMMGQTIVANAATVENNNDLITANGKFTQQGGEFEVNSRAAGGYKLTTRGTVGQSMTDAADGEKYLINRNYAFDGHGTDKVSDDTLKQIFGKDAKIIATVKGDKSDLSDYDYVIAEKLNSREIAQEKTQLDAMNADIKALEKAGYTITKHVKVSEGLSTDKNSKKDIVDIYKEGKTEVKAEKNGIVYTFTFNSDETAKNDTVTSLREDFESLKDSFKGDKKGSKFDGEKDGYDNKNNTLDSADYYLVEGNDSTPGEAQLNVHAGKDVENKNQKIKNRYYNLNSVIEYLSNNKDKFEIETKESSNREELEIKVYQKGLKTNSGLVQTITLVNYKGINTSLVSNAGQKTDFTGHWAESEIREAMAKGYVDTTNTFRPKDSITRAEFAKIVCTVFDISTDSDDIKNFSEPFNDVKSSNWYYKYIVALYNYQAGEKALTTVSTLEADKLDPSTDKIDKGVIINGYEDDNFKPNANITRQEAAKMMAAAYELKIVESNKKEVSDKDKFINATEARKAILNVEFDDKTTDKNTAFKEGNIDMLLNGVVDNVLNGKGSSIHRDVKTKFTDDKEIAAWADESVATLSGDAEKDEDLRILGGNPDGSFKPKSDINRAEALAMIVRAGDVVDDKIDKTQGK